MPNYIDAGPGFEQQLGAGLGNIVGGMLGRHFRDKRVAAFQHTLNDPNTSAIDKAIAYSKMDNAFKDKTSPVWAAVLGAQAQGEADTGGFSKLMNTIQQRQSGGNPPLDLQQVEQAVKQMTAQQQLPQQTQQPLLPNAQQQAPGPQIGTPQQPMAQQAVPATSPALATGTPPAKKSIVQNLSDTVSDDELGALAGSKNKQIASWAETALDRRQRNAKDNEEPLRKLSTSLQDLEKSQIQLDRMKELSGKGNFPNETLAAILSKDGQIDSRALSTLSDDAQEFVKLMVNRLAAAKDTFGSRITNFDAQTFLQGQPSLFTSPETRDRVIYSFQKVNELDQLYDRGMLEIFDEAGGADRIPYSKAERLFETRNRAEINRLKKQYVEGPKEFNGMPNANSYSGKFLKNPETGEVFRSDGKKWLPYEAK